MIKRYALRFEDVDGTVEDPYFYVATKRDALRFARIGARGLSPYGTTVAIWVDDTKTDLGVKRFPRPSVN